MTSTWTEPEEEECRKLLGILDKKLKEKNAEIHHIHHALYLSYILLRNVGFLTFITTGVLLFFHLNHTTILSVQTAGLFILLVLFGAYEFSGRNSKWFKALAERATLAKLRETVNTDLEVGSKREVGTWKDYNDRIRSCVL